MDVVALAGRVVAVAPVTVRAVTHSGCGCRGGAPAAERLRNVAVPLGVCAAALLRVAVGRGVGRAQARLGTGQQSSVERGANWHTQAAIRSLTPRPDVVTVVVCRANRARLAIGCAHAPTTPRMGGFPVPLAALRRRSACSGGSVAVVRARANATINTAALASFGSANVINGAPGLDRARVVHGRARARRGVVRGGASLALRAPVPSVRTAQAFVGNAGQLGGAISM
jgi:hypothetical protein